MTTNLKDEDIFLTTEEAAEFTKYTVRYLRLLRALGRGPVCYKNTETKQGAVRYKKKDLIEFIQKIKK